MKGLLFVNLGTPDSPRPYDVFKYLNEFLTDKRVIDFPWLQRQLLVRGLIVPTRFLTSAKSYRAIWTNKGSPLRVHTEEAAAKLQDKLGEEWQVEVAMRYQNPSIEAVLEKLKGCSEIVVLPLFPQYASATTGSIFEKVMEVLGKWAIIPKVRLIDSFYDHPGVISAFAHQAEGFDIGDYDKVLFSFHGLPVKQLTKSSSLCRKSPNCCKTNLCCYSAQCYKTADLLAEELKLKPSQWQITFQSRLGKDPWIEPYTSDVLKDLRQKGAKKILVFCPAFVADCLETIHEIAVEYEEEFRHLGGECLHLVPSLNSSDLWIDALTHIINDKAEVLKAEHTGAAFTGAKSAID